ncbi:restriction endonuclease subunit S [Acidithiobacillus ferriphilus]|uniref:restriction endonuclease subunit S n=1 Tax=Acidithiobacillus ferriphilus TaxID=1689834 RepID=UPI001C07A98C|nr:restriction endonuclease subunit S [Acidithiobacillus ferriphilus]MBU2830429.1 restriction endonuclease subunit S [Acidithiobacillus ferriphilus]
MKSIDFEYGDKDNGWIETDVASFAPFVYGKSLPEDRRSLHGQVPVYGSNGVIGFHDTPLVSNPTVVIGRKGTVDAVHFCKSGCWPIDTTFYFTDTDLESTRYAYYVLKSLGLNKMNSDSAVPGLNRDNAHTRIIRIPTSTTEQRRIAHILGTLDDKIENNRKTAKTLEAMAQAIFKSWFVDFDPVRAKMAGESRESICKRLKITPEILDLFPDRLVDSELGEIPEGWEVGTIIDIATISSGKRPENRLERPSEDAHIPLWGGNGPIGFVTEPLIYESCILTGRVGTLGTFFRINTPCWPSDNTLIIRAIKNAYYEYVFFNISQIDMTLLNRGSTQPLLTQSDLSSQPIVIPSSDIIGSFHDVSYTLLQYANFFSLNYSYVVIARDTLLPKLISGEIRVPEAKYCVEAAMSGEV